MHGVPVVPLGCAICAFLYYHTQGFKHAGIKYLMHFFGPPMEGMPLIAKVDRTLATDIELFSRGGQEILNAIERQDYAVLGRRPAISKARKLALVARAVLGKLLGKQKQR